MNQLNTIDAGMKGAVVSNNFNTNMLAIKTEIERLESLIKDLQGKVGPGGGGKQDEVYSAMSIVAMPESSILGTSSSSQVTEVPINVYYGQKKLVYNGYDDGNTSFSVDFEETNIYDSGELLAKIGAKSINSQLILTATIQPNVETTFSYTFEVIFMGVKYKKLISFNVIASDGQSALNIDLSPSTVIINESYSGGTLELDDAFCDYTVFLGNDDVTSNVTCKVTENCINCTGSINSSLRRVKIDSVTNVSHEGEGCRLFQWTDLDGTQHSVYKAVSGYVSLLFTYSTPGGLTYNCVKKFNFAVNYLGTFKESITNDLHTQVSEKVITTLSSSGCLLTESARTEILQDAETIALTAAKQTVSGLSKTYVEVTDKQFEVIQSGITDTLGQLKVNSENIVMALNGVSGNTTAINMTQGNIDLVVSGLTNTGINIQEGLITLSADSTSFCDSQGNQLALFGNGGISTELLSANTLTAVNARTENLTLNKAVAKNAAGKTTVEIDGNTGILKCYAGEFNGVSGSKFYDPANHYLKGNNFNISAYSNYDKYPESILKWDIEDSGKIIRLSHYFYNGKSVGFGWHTFTAPSGYYFYENGQQFSSLKMSRELIELIGYSSMDRFLGYIVLRRIDTMTQYKYGRPLKLLAYGHVLLSDVYSKNYKFVYKTFDNSELQLTKLDNSAGRLKISWGDRQWFREDSHVFVQVTGMGYINTIWNQTGSVTNNNCAKATVVNTKKDYFVAEISDDASSENNYGSFAFAISNLDDWWYDG